MASLSSSSFDVAIVASSTSSLQKKTKGRQKVEMILMEKESNRLVTFSKRRCGLFKKASELCTLCGAEAAIIVFSPGRKVYSFGHPSVDNALKRFIHSTFPSLSTEIDNETIFHEAEQTSPVGDLNTMLNYVNNQVEIEQKTFELLNGIKKANEQVYWWDRPLEEQNYKNLALLKSALVALKNDAIQHGRNRFMLEASNAASHFPVMGINHPMLGCLDRATFNPNGGFIGSAHNYY